MRLKPDYDKPNRLKKIPINPKTGQNASSTNPTTWGNFEQALEALRRFKLAGIGFVLGDGIFGVDIDHCIYEDKIDPQAEQIIDLFNSYTEISLSGEGIHILAFGHKTEGIKDCKYYSNFNGRGSDLEIYDHGRYFVVTGNVQILRPMIEATDKVAIVMKRYNHKADKAQRETVREDKLLCETDQKRSDNEVLAKLLDSSQI